MIERLELLRRRIPELWERPGRLLYVGAAPGRFRCGRELAEVGHKIVLLEIWEPYAALYREDPVIAEVIVGDVREVALDDYDVVFWWHGPEHVERGKVGRTLARLEARAGLVVVGCPWGRYEQGVVDGNPYQVHRSALYLQDFRRWGYRVVGVGRRDMRGKGFVVAWKERERPLPRVIACVIAFNEERMLPGCLESLQGQVDRIVVVDGAFAHFPYEEPTSVDATREIAQAYGAEWIDCPDDEDGYPRAWQTQVEKRSAYLIGEEGDWYLHVDADERLIGMLPVPEDGEHYAFLINTRDGRASWVIRLFQHRGRMRYEGSHNAVWSDERLVHLAGAVRVGAEECRLVHLSHLRDEERQLAKRRYYGWQKPAERVYRRAHSI